MTRINQIKILFLEDISSDFELINHTIIKAGIKFTGKLVEKKADYIDAIKSFCPDIILSDFNLPELNGMEALKIRNELSPGIPFILVTGCVNEKVAVHCINSGANDYVLKDDLSILSDAINDAVRIKARKS